MSRPTFARLSKPALKNNIDVIRKHAPNAQLMAMVKANAYGHGLRSVSMRIEPWVDGFGVATLDEALILRGVGIKKSIHIMQGFLEAHEARLCIEQNCVPVLSRMEHLEWLSLASQELSLEKPLFVWIKVQTGFNRLGFDIKELPDCLAQLEAQSSNWGLMTHWSCADDREHPAHKKQYSLVSQLLKTYPFAQISVNSSKGIMHLPEFNKGWVRAGAAIYGICFPELPLVPVMELRSEIILIKDCAVGETIGYNAAFTVTQPMRTAVVTIGYGDGYPRNVHNGYVLVHNKICPIVGIISMDMLVIDISDLKTVRVGDEVILWGPNLRVDEVARFSSTIPYELVSGICHRVTFQWIDA